MSKEIIINGRPDLENHSFGRTTTRNAMNTYFGNNCYCYNDECNQQEWEKQGKEGKRQYTVVMKFKMFNERTPKCVYCGKKMTVTANFFDDDGDYY
jgi:hypothetical protein